MRPAALVEEAAAGIGQRPGRSALTVLGTLLGTAAFVAVVGITATANGQIAGTFDALAATTVTVHTDTAGFPAGAEERVRRIDGVVAAGAVTDLYSPGRIGRHPPGSAVEDQEAEVVGVGDGYWRAARVRVTSGRSFSGYLATTRVAVISDSLAHDLGLDVATAPPVWIEGAAYTVVGTFAVEGDLGLPDRTVLLPDQVARTTFPTPHGTEPPILLVRTRLGAASVVADQVPVALDAFTPARYSASAEVEPTILRDRVSASLSRLFLVLALICLVIGAFGIANTSLVAVLERTPEIGLRRALGARPVHVATQFLIESAFLGLLGGMAGTVLGAASVLAVAVAERWTPIIATWALAASPVLGLVVGVLAGLHPAVRASRVEPVAALAR